MIGAALILGVGFGIIGLLLTWWLLGLEEADEAPPEVSMSVEATPVGEPPRWASLVWGLETAPNPETEQALSWARDRVARCAAWLAARWTALWGVRRQAERRLRRLLREADLPWHPAEWIGLTLGLMALGAWVGHRIYRLPGFVLLGILGGGALPFLFLRHRREARRRRLEAQLADALRLIAHTLQSGGSLYTAFEQIARGFPPPIAEEFRRALLEIQLGFSISEALEHMRTRVPSEDLSLAITAIQINQQVGGNLPEFLEMVAARIRDRVHIQNEIRVLTASYRLSAQILTALPVLLWLVLFPLNRRYMMRFFTSGLAGYALLGLILVLVLLGFLVIRRTMRVSL
ncbi:type II secretion system F family protein [Thermoflexus sp.]|uniref:type II secretion system F family protein n=1 Tax=Thermoflexus sp. TaxID=1969742 RepID=UPI0035E451A6